GPNNEYEALLALRAFPGGLQIGGGIRPDNALGYLQAGASHVIVTSWLFPEGKFNLSRLQELSLLVGAEKLVVDLSCRKKANDWVVAINRWQTITDVKLDEELFSSLAPYCAEYLIHAADVEGLRQGLDWDLVRHLSGLANKPLTYAGGANSLKDFERMQTESNGRIDLTIGSALDIFGGSEVRFQDCVEFNSRQHSGV
nr:phosphoribosylformimino-5-aminoimidazole carboxamide ribotide isomerase [Fibrobacterota bacterium]